MRPSPFIGARREPRSRRRPTCDYYWAFERNLRAAPTRDDDGTKPKLSETLIELATIVAGFAGVILLIDAVVTALN